MPKNHRIGAKVKEDVKVAFQEKARCFGGITPFIEKIAKFDIVILDKNTGKLLDFLELEVENGC